MARLQKQVGTLSCIQPHRTFIDGEYCRLIEFTANSGQVQRMENVFFTLKLCSILKPHTSGQFYFWNSHCYAFRNNEEWIEDIDGARESYLRRDAHLLVIMACSIVLLPVVMFITARKLV